MCWAASWLERAATSALTSLAAWLVNQLGLRFVDEGEDFASHTYARTGHAILGEPGGLAYQIFDQKTIHLLEERYELTGDPVVADTLEKLAQKLNLPVNEFLKTMNDYNDAAPRSGTFDPTRLDGYATTGLALRKSNWATMIDASPFVAYPVTCGITFTYGGIGINGDAQVLDLEDRPIPGLFATGEITGGFFYGNYPGGTGLMRGAVFGKIAGNNAASNGH
jgi:tricarballylate dehydrogenase